ncbi:hypothetical protein QQS21_011553 [Conoideocrella luteorostrata]|uniref:Uncharacterized protein n=1 Tax=Conoideocrella luteorostrata TaxID=1105319 RepID=A0AAJ0CDZ6_9HYPO|nr:hypothetical protein QQS21_011553 [Conoideocrella luteorostrata]
MNPQKKEQESRDADQKPGDSKIANHSLHIRGKEVPQRDIEKDLKSRAAEKRDRKAKDPDQDCNGLKWGPQNLDENERRQQELWEKEREKETPDSGVREDTQYSKAPKSQVDRGTSDVQIFFDYRELPPEILDTVFNERFGQDQNHGIRFDEVLMYVRFPNVTVVQKGTRAPKRRAPGRQDAEFFFNWLYAKGVRRILRVEMEDSDKMSHSDELIQPLTGEDRSRASRLTEDGSGSTSNSRTRQQSRSSKL